MRAKPADNQHVYVPQGKRAAKKLGIKLVKKVFDHSSDWPCPLLEKTFAAMVETGVIPRMPDPICVAHDNHMSNASHIVGAVQLEDKVGECVAKEIKTELQGTEYEWMLDLSKPYPPFYQEDL